MAVFDKLMFWKKKDELGIPNPNRDAGLQFNDFGQQPPQGFQQFPPQGYMPPPSFQQPQMDSFQNQQGYRQNKDMELISAKLDAIKAMLENLNQRVANLEKVARGEVDLNDINRRRNW